MKSFIVLTFAFLGFALYYLSGGADFEPRQRMATDAQPAGERAESGKPSSTARPADTAGRDPAKTSAIARLAPEPEPETAVRTAVTTAPATADRTPDSRSEQTIQSASSDAVREQRSADIAQVRSSLSQGLSLFGEAQTGGDSPAGRLTLVSLGDGGSRLAAASSDGAEPSAPDPAPATATVAPRPDIREVIATRVNMRDGPGTTYPVVARVTIGRKVEILDDPGAGWLRLRTLPDGQPGWIAASLISKATSD